MVIDTALLLGIVNMVGLVAVAMINRRQSPAQKVSEIIKNYGDLIEQYRKKIVELSNELDRVEKERQEDTAAHEIEINNNAAITKKREIEYEQEVSRLRNELRAYQIGWAELRRVAVKYVPRDVILPEIGGTKTPQDIK